MVGVLLRDDAARDAIAGVSGGITFLVVGVGVDDERSAAVCKDRIGSGCVHRNAIIHDGLLEGPIFLHVDVGHVALMWAVGIFQSVVLVTGIEMRAGGLEV